MTWVGCAGGGGGCRKPRKYGGGLALSGGATTPGFISGPVLEAAIEALGGMMRERYNEYLGRGLLA
eukprot:8863278-Lingulodinium_polyedra.AAC.1